MATELRQSESTGPTGRIRPVRTTHPLVLASSSPRRASILRRLGLEFEVLPADVDETARPGQSPEDLALSLAESKAGAVARIRPGAAVVAADTVVALDGAALGKPVDCVEAMAMLRSLSGRSHLVHTGVAVRLGGVTRSGVETTEVRMRQLSDSEIDVYVRSGAALDKAGAYGIQDSEFSPVESFHGSYLNVVGLPAGLLADLLLATGEIESDSADLISGSDEP
ncbi:MAG: Maf family protein [Chloroflexi bacterium]|nr:Maf family protein [Chloroflexota bacterium]MDA1297521.1 Maf family protein [Chloroflexota bacterium]